MYMHKIKLSALAFAVPLSLSGSGLVWGQDITVTDISGYPSIGIDASRYDDKLVDNTVVVDIRDDSEIKRFISYGSHSDKNNKDHDLHGNKTFIENGHFTDVSIYGSASEYRFVNHNSVQIDNGTFKGSRGAGINGGYSIEGTVYANNVIVNQGYFDNLNINGGYSFYGSISKNNIIINGGEFSGVDLYGGSSNYIGIVSDNKVIINGADKGEFEGIYGGISAQGLLARNSVIVNTDISAIEVIGGYGDAEGLAAAYGNSVTVNSSSVQVWDIIGAKNDNGAAYDNSVNINKGDIYGTVYGAITYEGKAHDNKVNISGGSSMTGNAIGGYTANFDNNSAAENNTVVVSGSNIEGSVIGGYGSGNASGSFNIVEVLDSDIKGNVIGGVSEAGTADGNTVILKGERGRLYDMCDTNIIGGYSGINTGSDNRLIVDSWAGNIKSIKGLNEIIFGNVNWENGGTVINITDGATDLSSVDIGGKWISFGFADPKDHIGQTMQLIKSEHGIDFNEKYDGTGSRVDFQEGLTHNIYGNIVNNAESSSVDFTIEGRRQNEQLKLMTYNRNMGMSLVKQGNDIVSDIMRDTEHHTGIKTFAAMQGNFSSYDVGGDAELNGWSGIVGVGNTDALDDDTLTYGIFFENGAGSYKAYNTFNDNYFRFDGSAVYNGGGIAVRLDKADGIYTQASLRAGSLKNELKNGLYDGSDNSYGYTADTLYYSVGLELGKKITLTEHSALDMYTSFSYTHFEDTDFTISGPNFTDEFHFGDVDSKVVKAGMRLINKIDDFLLYYGTAYEYEFDGRSNITTKGEYIDDDGGLKGGTLIGEIGASYKKSSDADWVFDVKLRGYGGNRRGISMDIQATYLF